LGGGSRRAAAAAAFCAEEDLPLALPSGDRDSAREEDVGPRALAARAHGPGPRDPLGFFETSADEDVDVFAVLADAGRPEPESGSKAPAFLLDALAPRLHGSALSGVGAPYTRLPL
jgi:hypothetical protein